MVAPASSVNDRAERKYDYNKSGCDTQDDEDDAGLRRARGGV